MAAIFGAVNYSSVHQAEVEEAQRDFEFEIQELLLTAGYFRARIANLSPFDKARDMFAKNAALVFKEWFQLRPTSLPLARSMGALCAHAPRSSEGSPGASLLATLRWTSISFTTRMPTSGRKSSFPKPSSLRSSA